MKHLFLILALAFSYNSLALVVDLKVDVALAQKRRGTAKHVNLIVKINDGILHEKGPFYNTDEKSVEFKYVFINDSDSTVIIGLYDLNKVPLLGDKEVLLEEVEISIKDIIMSSNSNKELSYQGRRSSLTINPTVYFEFVISNLSFSPIQELPSPYFKNFKKGMYFHFYCSNPNPRYMSHSKESDIIRCKKDVKTYKWEFNDNFLWRKNIGVGLTLKSIKSKKNAKYRKFDIEISDFKVIEGTHKIKTDQGFIEYTIEKLNK